MGGRWEWWWKDNVRATSIAHGLPAAYHFPIANFLCHILHMWRWHLGRGRLCFVISEHLARGTLNKKIVFPPNHIPKSPETLNHIARYRYKDIRHRGSVKLFGTLGKPSHLHLIPTLLSKDRVPSGGAP